MYPGTFTSKKDDDGDDERRRKPKLSTGRDVDDDYPMETDEEEDRPKLKETKALPLTRRQARLADEVPVDEDGLPVHVEDMTRAQYVTWAKKARLERRGVKAQGIVVKVTPNVTAKLAAAAVTLSEAQGHGDNQATVAIGRLTNGQFVVYSQRWKPDADEAFTAIQSQFDDVTARDIIIVPTHGDKSGRHAEVMLWHTYAEEASWLQQVGASQSCCVDCTGFLNLNGVAHSASDPSTAKGRPYWWDPELDVRWDDNGTDHPKETPGSSLKFKK